MIEKIANNESNRELLNLNPPAKVKERLEYFRSYFNKTHDLPPADFDRLKKEISTFFNLKPTSLLAEPPTGFIRISNNNSILASQGKELSYLTDISQLLAPPIQHCNFNRCNIPGQQVLYCANSEASAYWGDKAAQRRRYYNLSFQAKAGSQIELRSDQNGKNP